MLEIASCAVPLLLSMTLCAPLAVPTRCAPNERLDGLSVTVGAGFAPVPVRPSDCGLSAALSFTWTEATRVPAPVGVKATEIAQVALTVRVGGQLSDSA